METRQPESSDRMSCDERPGPFRTSVTGQLMMAGVPVPVINQQLGHASLATTDRYLRHIASKDVVEVSPSAHRPGV
jgi:site-specific recombinase XerD